MAHDWDSRSILDALDQLIPSSGHYQVDISILGQKRRDGISSRDGLDECIWDLGSCQCFRDEGREERSGMYRFLAAFQDRSVPCLLVTVKRSRKRDEDVPDLMARAAILTTTSGLASKITSSTPTGQVTRCSSSSGPISFANVTIPVGAGRTPTSVIPCNIASYLPGLVRSNLETSDFDNFPWDRSSSAA